MKRKREEIRLHNLELLVAEAGSAVKLARRAKTSESYLSQIRRGLPTSKGTARAVGDALAHKLERATGKPNGWMDEPHPPGGHSPLASPQVGPPPLWPPPAYHPLLSWVQAGYDTKTRKSQIPPESQERFLCPVPCSESTFVLKVSGDSMAPKFHSGELIYVDPDVAPENGRYVLARLGDADEAVLRRLVIEGGRTYLQALNPDWPDRIREVGDSVTILGVVVFKGEVA